MAQEYEKMQSRYAQGQCEQLSHDWKEWHVGKIHSLVVWTDFAFPAQQKSDFLSFKETSWILGVD